MVKEGKKQGFISGVIEEMKAVSWPSGKQWRKDFIVVVEMCIIFALFFGLADFAIEKLIQLIIK